MFCLTVRAGLAASLGIAVFALGATAQPVSKNLSGAPPPPLMTIVTCPSEVTLKLVPLPDPMPGGWMRSYETVRVKLDPVTPARVSEISMICYYGPATYYVLQQPTNGQVCKLRPDKKSFLCTSNPFGHH